MNSIWKISEFFCKTYLLWAIKIFLLLNTLFWGIFALLPGFLVWKAGIFPHIGLGTMLFLFSGYAMAGIGMFGGILFLMRRNIGKNIFIDENL